MRRSSWLTAMERVGNGLKTRLQPLKTRLLKDPYYRFQNAEELALAAQIGVVIDANQATVDDWLRLPGLSIHQARSLVSLQRSGLQFHCLEDIAAALSVPVSNIQRLAPVLRFCYYDADSICTIQPVNPNSASVEQLTRIPDVDLFLARAIVQNREQRGRFQSMADLQQRLALPASLMGSLMHYLVL
ncbi:ComEA family DNA-binding protein [Leptolyngbya sp. CCY15150]|uniref:helix-hairpin-helix domain-containing protein n=1 Tax=Leptolyngbya sp. CCY15150 TaxID=2767772 RepID=UPI001EF29DB2|nr:ComEA family DNA-binding protein [Leptolyngbya sp. CCY15150]